MAELKHPVVQEKVEGAAATRGAPPEFGAKEGTLREFANAFLHDLSRSRENAGGAARTAEWKSSASPSDESSIPGIEARYRALVEQIPAVVFMAPLDGGLSETYVSPQIERVLGFTQEEWLEDPVRWFQRIHPDDRARWSAEAAETCVTGEPLKSIYRVIARDGRVVWFHCEVKLVRKKSGEPWFLHGVGFDITGLKETEQALRSESAERERLRSHELERQIAKVEQTESRLAAIVESSEDAIIGKSLEGVINSWNVAAGRLFGYQPEEILGRSILLLVPPDLHNEEMDILRSLRAGRRIAHRETQRLTKGGVRVDVSLTISPIKDAGGQVIGVSTIARDITERKQSEEKMRVAEKLAAAGRLAATVSHEINNPLEAVTNLIYLAKREPQLPPGTCRLLEEADAELQRVAHITRQTLGFYRDSTSPVPINVAGLLNDIVELYRSKIKRKALRVDVSAVPCCDVCGLQGEIRQVFSNILSNAIEASSSRGALVLRAKPARAGKDSEKNGVRVSIGDAGSGIPLGARARVFEPFFSTKENVGTGLGLWVSKSLVEKHGGSIRFRSSVTPGRAGTVFSVFLPCQAM